MTAQEHDDIVAVSSGMLIKKSVSQSEHDDSEEIDIASRRVCAPFAQDDHTNARTGLSCSFGAGSEDI